MPSGGQETPRGLSDRDILAEVDILDCIKQSDTFFDRSLECFAARNKTHAAGALVDDSSDDSISEVPRPFGFAAAINQAGAAHVTVGNLIAAKVDRMITGQLRIDSFIEFAVTGVSRVKCFEAAIVLGQLLLNDISLDGYPEMIGLP